METLGGFPSPRPLPAALQPARFARPRAFGLRRRGRGPKARGGGRAGGGSREPGFAIAAGQAIAKRLRAFGADLEPIEEFAIARCLAMDVDVDFDRWQNERQLHDQGHVMATLEVLDRAGFIEGRHNAQKVGVSAPQVVKRSQAADETRGMEEA